MASPDGLAIGCAVAAGVVFGFPAAIAAIVIALAIRLGGGRISGWRLFAIAVLVGIGSLRHPDPFSTNDASDVAASDRARGKIDSIPVARPNGDRAIFHVDQVRLNGEWRSTDLRVVGYLPENREVTVGDEVEVVWSFSSLDAMPPGFAGYIRSQDAAGSASIWSVQVTKPSTSPRRYLVNLRRNVSAKILELVPGDAGALMSGIVTGDDSALSVEARDAFARTGTGHITAVSGSNIAMLLAIWSRAFRSRTRRHHLLVQLAIVGSIWAYCISTGLEASALRATTVATLVVWSGRFGRRADPLTVLALASCGLLLLEPSLSGSVGFWLSVTASGAIAGSFPFDRAESLRDGSWMTIRALVAAQAATLPIIVWSFGSLPAIGIVANLVISPIMVAAFPVTFLFAAFAFVPLLGELFAIVPALLSDMTLAVVERLAPVMSPLRLETAGSLGAAIVAVPCAVIVLCLNRDVDRWIPRWTTTVQRNPDLVAASVCGVVTGAAMALVAIRLFL